MAEATEYNELPVDFEGNVRLFPLPSLVLFPHVVQPLHIFEPRYREMLEATLKDDQLIAMALLRPGWETSSDERPSIYPVTCVGRVVSHTRLDDGRYNLLLAGVRRATVIRELNCGTPYRQAEVAILEDLYPAAGAARRTKMRRQITDAGRQLLEGSPAGREQFEQFTNHDLPLGVLTDILAFSLHLDMAAKQCLLSEWNVDTRAELLLELLRRLLSGQKMTTGETPSFPPGFSRN